MTLSFRTGKLTLGRLMPHSLLISTILLPMMLLSIMGTAASSAYATSEEPMVIRYINRGALDAGNAYKFELIKAILEETKKEFGDYRIEPYVNDPGAKRISVLVKQGAQINVTWASPGTVRDSTHVIPIPIDILQGMLGYRVCLTTLPLKTVFDNITDIDTLKTLRIGQGQTWEDVDIYTANHISTIQAPTLDGLLSMLALNRFDCLALGVTEAMFIYKKNVPYIETLVVEKNLLIHYEYPIYFYISAKHPKIAARFNEGIQKIQTNGEFNKIFNRYFREDINTLNLKNRRVICLKSPFLPLENQCQKLVEPGIFDSL